MSDDGLVPGRTTSSGRLTTMTRPMLGEICRPRRDWIETAVPISTRLSTRVPATASIRATDAATPPPKEYPIRLRCPPASDPLAAACPLATAATACGVCIEGPE